MLRAAVLLFLGLIVASRCASGEEPGGERRQRPVVFQVQLQNEAITPITARYIERAIEEAEQHEAACLVIMLDTPGGLVDSTRRMVGRILRSEVPVVVYVAPSGGRAASAGVFITLSAHVAAMAPGTNIGAAHPVQIGGLPGSPPPDRRQNEDEEAEPAPSPMQQKIVSDTVAWARALAELRGRNADWAARAVRESLSVSASEALRENVVDLMADDLNDLLAQIDGREVQVPAGPVTLNTADAEVRTIEMWWGEQVLAVLVNPNLAFLLLMFGFYGILFEMYSPGWGVPGTLGIICLVLAFLGMAFLPINYVGLILVALALALFTAEVFVTSYGALTAGGIICLVLGGLMLVDSPAGFAGVSLTLLIPIAVATAGITFFLVGSVVRSHWRRVLTGSEGMVGTDAVAVDDFEPNGNQYSGTVRAHGELWRAVSPAPATARQSLEVYGREGLTLLVRHRKPNAAEPHQDQPTQYRPAP